MSNTPAQVSEYLARIGRTGGLKKGRKGAATYSQADRKAFSRRGVEARKRNAALRAQNQSKIASASAGDNGNNADNNTTPQCVSSASPKDRP